MFYIKNKSVGIPIHDPDNIREILTFNTLTETYDYMSIKRLSPDFYEVSPYPLEVKK